MFIYFLFGVALCGQGAISSRIKLTQEVNGARTSSSDVMVVLVNRNDAVLTKLEPAGSANMWSIAAVDKLQLCVSKEGAVVSELPCKIKGTAKGIVPKNQKKGGQSAPRFQRSYLDAKTKWVNHVADVIGHVLLNVRPAGILVAGNADVPTLLNKVLSSGKLPGDVPVASQVLVVSDLSAHAVREALKKGQLVMKELAEMAVASDPATAVLRGFPTMLEQGYATVSQCSVEGAIENGVLKTLMVCPDKVSDIQTDVNTIQVDPQLSPAHAIWCKNFGIGAVLQEYVANWSYKPWEDDCMNQ